MQSTTDKLKGYLEDAIGRLSLGDEVIYDLGFVFNPQGPPAHLALFTMPAAVLGEYHQAGGIIEQGHKVSQANIDELVGGALEKLREERSKALNPKSDGEKQTGLIIP